MNFKQIKEFIIEKAIFLSGSLSIIFVILIFVFLIKEGALFFKYVPIKDFLTGTNWYPLSTPEQFGMLPLIMGSLLVTIGAMIISIPLGVACAFYIAEVVNPKLKDVLKTGVELLAAIPSVVIGFVGMVTLVPLVKNIFNLPTGLTALSGSIMLAFMAMPTIVSIAEDAITAVPRRYKEAALALGATHWQAMYKVIIVAAAPGIFAAVMLGVGRVIGETMAVMMITGNAAVIPHTFLQPVRTLTATIAAEMGEAIRGSNHYYALFVVGIILFIITFAINFIADVFLHRIKK
ncbi:MAG: phosphate ABC transporter permease subunit PstC [Elusimicrobia bacterium RIFOXYA2_FULL_39_19]|nr:MAG: phosphate ABC transporter permease subunit PstC [Elusimicrobia bacterium RIFOXYA2_FULL_39_19]